MSRNFMFLTSLSFILFSTNFAFALTCRNDYSGTSGCAGNQNAAGNCETLGYYTSDVANCRHYIYCPFDTSYKRCTSTDKCNKNKDSNCLIWSSSDTDCQCIKCISGYELNENSICTYEYCKTNLDPVLNINTLIFCYRDSIPTAYLGYYYVRDSCTNRYGEQTALYARCDRIDCDGNKGPAYGLKSCGVFQSPSGTTVECGGIIYSSECAECEYKQYKSDCTSEQTFVPHCKSSLASSWIGECI